jgi:hypothetical protein
MYSKEMDAHNWLFKTHMITNNINKKVSKIVQPKIRENRELH